MKRMLSGIFLGATFGLAAPANACGVPGTEEAVSIGQHNLATVERFAQHLTAKNLEGVVALLTEDATWSQPFQPSGAITLSGRPQITVGYEWFFATFNTIRFGARKYTVSNDGCTVFAEMQGDFDLTGGAGDYDNFFVFRLDFAADGRVSALTHYMNSFYTAQTFQKITGRREHAE
jgi:ketosteroid isomerase-like protein